MAEAEDTLRDIIETAVEDAPELAAPETPLVEAVAAPEAKPDRVRDEGGKFAKDEPKAEAKPDLKAEKKPESKAAEDSAAKRPPRPSSWKKEYWEKWDQLAESDPGLADYLGQREQQYAQGVSTYKAEADRGKELQTILEPHAVRFQAFGVTPGAYVDRLLKMDQVLSTGTVQEKMNMLQAIAAAIGLGGQPAQGTSQAPPAQIPPELLQTMNGLQTEVQRMKQAEEARAQAAYQREIDTFAAKAPYLDELQEPMALLLEKGLATDLDDAYHKALAWNPELSAKAHAAQRSEQERQEAAKQTAARARSNAVSPRSGTPTGNGAASTQGGDIRSIVSAAFETHAGGGRI